MIQESKRDRIQKAYKFLYDRGLVHSVTDLAVKMGRTRPGVSNAINGAPEYLNDKFMAAFSKTFNGIFSLDWLLTGNGTMLMGDDANGHVKVSDAEPAPYIPTWADAFFDIMTNQVKQNEALNRELRESIASVNQLKAQLTEIIERLNK